MADVVDLAGARVIHAEQTSEHRMQSIREILNEVGHENDANNIRALIIITLDDHNNVETQVARMENDDVLLIGAIEVLKSDLMANLRSSRALEIE